MTVEENAMAVDGDEGIDASDAAFLATELEAEAEDPVLAPSRVEERAAYRFAKRAFNTMFSPAAISLISEH